VQWVIPIFLLTGINLGFQVFLVVTATSMALSTTLAPTEPGGLLQSTLRLTLGTGTCTTITTMFPLTLATRNRVFQFVASGIELTIPMSQRLSGQAKPV